MPAPAVDVVIATRGDRAEMLDEAVASVYAQDYDGEIAITVVYDGAEEPPDPISPPVTAGRTCRTVWNAGPHGLAQARNRGAREGTHDLMAFLDDDDLWRPTKLRRQVALLESRPSAQLVGSGITIVDQDGHETPRPSPMATVRHQDLLRSRVAELHPSSFVMRRAAFDAVGGVDEDLPGAYAEDYDLVLSMSRQADIAMVVEPLTVVRWTGGSYFFSRWQTIATALRYLLDKHPDLAADRRGSARILGQIAFAEAAMADRKSALKTIGRAAWAYPLEPRIALAGVVTAGYSADKVQQALHRRGRGI